MKSKILFFALVLICGVAMSAGKNIKLNREQKLRENKEKLERPCNKFAIDLYQKLAVKNKENLFISPYSIYEALAMLNLGAAGETEIQIAKVLYFKKERPKQYQETSELYKHILSLGKHKSIDLDVANALFADKSQEILPTFQDDLKKYYSAKIFSLDFRNDTVKSCAKLNKWIKKKTRGHITDMVEPASVPSLVALYLVNAIYFKGEWRQKFRKGKTKKRTFTCLDGKKIKVPTMYQENDFFYSDNDEAQLLGMRYRGGSVSMGIILPKPDIDFTEFEKGLTITKIQEICLKAKTKPIKVYLPKFKFGSNVKLNSSLKEMGLVNAFEFKKANFSKTSPRKLYVSRVLHRSVIKVHEKGAIAVAATAVEYDFIEDLPTPKVFRANRPFIFFIQAKDSKVILFMGRVMKPVID